MSKNLNDFGLTRLRTPFTKYCISYIYILYLKMFTWVDLQYVDVQSNQARSETTKHEDMSNQILDREFAPSLKVLWVQVKEVNSRHFKVPSKLQATSFLFGTCVRWWLISSDPRIKNSQMACSRLVVIYRPSHGLQAVRGGVRVICRIRPFVEDDVWCSDQSRAKDHVFFMLLCSDKPTH
jgi:hypothetical protein